MNQTLKKLLRNKPFICCILVCVLILVALVAAYIGDMFALNNLTIKAVTPTSMAMAMRQDDFWYTYRENTLIFNGSITSLSQQDSQTLVGIKSHDPYSVTCTVDSNPNLKVGESRKFGAETYQAERQPAGILLNHCVVLN